MTERGTNSSLGGVDPAPDAGIVRHARQGNFYPSPQAASPDPAPVLPQFVGCYAGRMFWFTRNRLWGSYARLTEARRA